MFEFFHQRNLADGGGRSALFGIEVDLLERYQLARLAVAAFENLAESVRAATRAWRVTYGGIGALAQLLQLLEGAGMPAVVHGRDDLAAAEVSDADGGVGAVGD